MNRRCILCSCQRTNSVRWSANWLQSSGDTRRTGLASIRVIQGKRSCNCSLGWLKRCCIEREQYRNGEGACWRSCSKNLEKAELCDSRLVLISNYPITNLPTYQITNFFSGTNTALP